jgi:hypothetical protein
MVECDNTGGSFLTQYVSLVLSNLAAARALMSVEDMGAEDVAKKAMDIAADMCVYTNKNFIHYTLDDVGDILAEAEGDNKK